MSECIFCKIVAGDIPGDIVYQTDDILAFRDIDPKAPTHILIIPKAHVATLNDLDEAYAPLAGRIVAAAAEIAEAEGIAESGYRLVWNCNREGGQEVYHIHLHLLGGRQMRWPPG